MNWLSYFIPQTIIHTSSKYNRDIRVVMENGKKKLLVNGIQQSGPMIEGFWNFAFSHLGLPSATQVKTILVLGVGGGTVIHKLHLMYPAASVTGVDIDREVIRIAKIYFNVQDRLICEDAITFIKKKNRYDLIIVDLYIGRDIPKFEESKVFVRNLKRAGKMVVFNYLHDGIYKKRAEDLVTILRKEFKKTEFADLPYNRFFLVIK